MQRTLKESNHRGINMLVYFASIMALLILFGSYNGLFNIIAASLLGVYLYRADEDDSIAIMMFLMPMAYIFKISASSSSLMTYIELFFVLVCFGRRHFKLRRRYIWIIAFTLYNVITQLIHGGLDVTTTIKITAYLLIIAFATEGDVKSSYKKIFLAFIIGVIVSSLMRYADSNFFKISSLMQMKREHLGYGVYITRFSGLYGDPNYYSINVIIASILVAVLLRKGKLSTFQSGILIAPLVYFAAITGSKSALLMLAVVLVFVILAYIEKKQYLLSTIITAFGVIAVLYVFSGKSELFSNTIDRFIRSSESSGGITTNRSIIWNRYFHYLMETPLVLLFGRSMLFYTLGTAVTHNTYIDIIYELGVVGGTILVLAIKGAFNATVKFKRQFMNYSAAICVAVMYAFLSELQYFDPPFHLILAYFVINLPLRNEPEPRTNKSESIDVI